MRERFQALEHAERHIDCAALGEHSRRPQTDVEPNWRRRVVVAERQRFLCKEARIALCTQVEVSTAQRHGNKCPRILWHLLEIRAGEEALCEGECVVSVR